MSVEIDMDVKGFKDGLNTAKQSTREFTNAMDRAESANADYQSRMDKTQLSVRSFNKELRQAKRDAMDLSNAFNSLSSSDKLSGMGRQLQQQMEEAVKRAAELTDLKGDVQRQINNIASDTRMFDIASESISTLANTLGAVASGYAAVTGDQEAYNRAVTIFTGTQQTLTALTQIQNALQKESNLMTAVGAVQSAARAAAVRAEASALAGATIAQKAFNVVASANPYVLLATALIAVGTAVAGYVAYTKKATEEEEERRKAIERTRAAVQALGSVQVEANKQTIAEVAKFRALKATLLDTNRSYDDRRRALDEIKKAVPEYHGSLTKEGVLLNNNIAVLDAYVVNLQKAAVAQAAFNKMTEIGGKIIDAEQKSLRAYNGSAAAFNAALRDGVNLMDVKYIDSYGNAISHNGKVLGQFTQAQRKNFETWKEQNALWKDANGEVKNLNKTMDVLGKTYTKNNVVVKVDKQTNKTSTTTKKVKTDNKDAVKEIDDLEKKIKKLESDMSAAAKAGKWGIYNSLSEELEKAQKELQDVKLAKWKYEVEVEGKINNKLDLSSMQGDLFKNLFQPPKPQDIQKQIQKVADDATRNITVDKFQKLGEDAVQQFTSKMVVTEQDISEFRRSMAVINNVLSEVTGGDIEMHFDFDTTVEEKIEEFKQYIDDFHNAMSGHMADIQEQWTAFGLALTDGVNTKDIGAGLSMLGQQLEQLGEDGAVAKAGSVLAAIGQIILGFATATAQASSMGPWGWIAFVAAGLATVATAISTIQSFSTGGIVGGGSYTGDNTLIRANAGELVLNNKQQKRLFDMLDGKTQRAGDAMQPVVLETRLRGTDIMLSQKNLKDINNL